jgi:hypothetical protein
MSVSTNDDNGGPAFPVTNWSAPGMSLRDYFAAAALQAILSSSLSGNNITGYHINEPCFMECVALDAYAHADAMLLLREVKP